MIQLRVNLIQTVEVEKLTVSEGIAWLILSVGIMCTLIFIDIVITLYIAVNLGKGGKNKCQNTQQKSDLYVRLP